MAVSAAKTPRKAPLKTPESPVENVQEEEPESGAPTMQPHLLYPLPEGTETLIRIHRMDDRTKEWVPYGKLDDDEAELDFIARQFGGGKFRVVRHRMNEEGSWIFAGQRTFHTPGPAKAMPGYYGVDDDDEDQTATPGPVHVPGHPSTGEALNIALASQVLELVKKAGKEEVSRVSSTNWGPLITGGLSLLTTIVTKLMDKKEVGPDPQLMAQLQGLKTELGTLKNQPGPASTAMTDMLDSIERIVKVSSRVRKLAQGDDEPVDREAAMWGMGKTALEAMMSGQSPTAALSPGTQPAPSAAPSPTGSGKPLWERVLLHHSKDMLQAASRGVDATLAAEWTTNMLPQEVHGVVMEFLRKPDAAAIAIQVVPDLGSFPQWTEAFVTAARGIMLQEDEVGGNAEMVEVMTEEPSAE